MTKKILAALLAVTMVFGSGVMTAVNVLPDTVVTASAETYGDYEYTVLDDGTVEITKYIGYDTEIDIPAKIGGKSITRIGENAFRDCESLTNVTIPDSVTVIDSWAFWGCSNLTSITIPDSVTIIDWCAFYDCTGLTSITIPNNVMMIGYCAFYGCTGLTSIKIPDSVTRIDNGAFCCGNIVSIDVDPKNSFFSSENGVLYDKNKNTLLVCPQKKKDIVIPNSVTSIGLNAFYGCTGLTSITIPDSVTSIEDNAFENCPNLSSITIPASVEDIGDCALGYYDYYDEGIHEELKVEDFKIYCYKGTAGEKYAIDNEFEYELLKKDDTSSNPAPKPMPSHGNVNGDDVIDVGDVVSIVNNINGVTPLTPEQEKLADVDGNGVVDIQDAVAIINHINGVKALTD